MLITSKTRAESTNAILQHVRNTFSAQQVKFCSNMSSGLPGKLLVVHQLTQKSPLNDWQHFFTKLFQDSCKSNAYLQFIPAGSRLFCTRCTRCTKPLFQIVYTDCMTYWKTKKRVLIRDIFHSVALYCHFSMLIQLCWWAKTRPTQQLSMCCLFFRDITGQSLERWWVWQLFLQCICS